MMKRIMGREEREDEETEEKIKEEKGDRRNAIQRRVVIHLSNQMFI